MKMSNRAWLIYTFVAVFFTVTTGAVSCFAGAWTMPQGKAYVKLSMNAYDSDKSFNADGDEANFEQNGTFEDRNVGLYVEYGLKDNISLVYSGSYKFLEKKDDLVKREFNGFSDMDIAVKYRLMNNPFGVATVQGLVKIPEAYNDDEFLLPGNAQYDYEIRLMVGRSLYPAIPGYINIEGAYRLRDDAPADEMRFLGEFGVDFLKRGFARIKAEAIVGMDNEDDLTANSNPNLSADYDLVKMSMTVGCRITENWGVEVETIREIAGAKVSKGNTYSAALTCLY